MGFSCRGVCLSGALALMALGCATTQGERAAQSPVSPPATPVPPTASASASATASSGFAGPAQQTRTSAESKPSTAQLVATGNLKHVDAANGFEIERPSETWSLYPGDEFSTEVIAVPVVLLEEAQGAQVVVQIAPAIASPPEFAERLIEGLSTRGEFSTGEIYDLELAEGAVGFDFIAAEQVIGRVAILEGSNGKVFVLLATWPMNAPQNLDQEIDAILGSMKVL